MTQIDKIKVFSFTSYDRQLPLKDLPRDDTDKWIGYFPNIPNLRICWSTLSRVQVLQHVYKTPHIETGGVLLGNVYRTSQEASDGWPIDFIEIRGAIAAKQVTAEPGIFTFTHDVWANILRTYDLQIQQHRIPEDTRIIGWYHTHPGHGIFLSSQDQYIHENFFSQDYQFALVIETHDHKGAFFVESKRMGGPYESNLFIWDEYIIALLKGSPRQVNHPQGSYSNFVPENYPVKNTEHDIIITEDELAAAPIIFRQPEDSPQNSLPLPFRDIAQQLKSGKILLSIPPFALVITQALLTYLFLDFLSVDLIGKGIFYLVIILASIFIISTLIIYLSLFINYLVKQ